MFPNGIYSNELFHSFSPEISLLGRQLTPNDWFGSKRPSVSTEGCKIINFVYTCDCAATIFKIFSIIEDFAKIQLFKKADSSTARMWTNDSLLDRGKSSYELTTIVTKRNLHTATKCDLFLALSLPVFCPSVVFSVSLIRSPGCEGKEVRK